MKRITVSPKKGLTVRHPETGQPILDGADVELTPQIKRYLKDGDLTESKSKKKASPTKESD